MDRIIYHRSRSDNDQSVPERGVFGANSWYQGRNNVIPPSISLVVQDMLDKVARNELSEDAPEELSNLLIDRDTCEKAWQIISSKKGFYNFGRKKEKEGGRGRAKSAMFLIFVHDKKNEILCFRLLPS